MTTIATPSRKPLRLATLLFVSLALLASPAAAQPFVYGLNADGQLSVNGTLLDSLPSNFNADTNSNLSERWEDLAIAGADRYVLRRDGLLFKNGESLHVLEYDLSENFDWISMALMAGGVAVTLRQDGRLAEDGDGVATLPIEEGDAVFPFRQVLVSGSDTYALRADGAVFENGEETPSFQFTGGEGVSGFLDGLAADTIWLAMAFDPLDGRLYALRSDGLVRRTIDVVASGGGAGVDEDTTASVTSLPFPETAGEVGPGDFYLDFDFTAAGDWLALRANGEVYTEDDFDTPAVDLPGDAADENEVSIDLAIDGDDFWAIRVDGRVYKNTDGIEQLNLPASGYVRVAIGETSPDVSNVKNRKPVVALYKIKAVEGETIVVPVVATDIETPAEDLVVTVTASPPGSSWDAETRILTWENSGPIGSYTFSVLIDDGVASPVKAAYKIQVIAADTDPEKNKNPLAAKIKKPQLLVGFETELLILASDPDSDELTISTDEEAYPFTAGASFDAETGIFSWTPSFEDIGKPSVLFLIDDGTKVKKFKLSMTVVNSLIF